MSVVRRPVDGIDNPPVPAPLEHVLLLLGDDKVIREARGNEADDPLLAFQVHVGHDVGLTLVEDRVDLLIMSLLYPAGLEGKLYGEFEELMHGYIL